MKQTKIITNQNNKFVDVQVAQYIAEAVHQSTVLELNATKMEQSIQQHNAVAK
jgi:hypothetical protein